MRVTPLAGAAAMKVAGILRMPSAKPSIHPPHPTLIPPNPPPSPMPPMPWPRAAVCLDHLRCPDHHPRPKQTVPGATVLQGRARHPSRASPKPTALKDRATRCAFGCSAPWTRAPLRLQHRVPWSEARRRPRALKHCVAATWPSEALTPRHPIIVVPAKAGIQPPVPPPHQQPPRPPPTPSPSRVRGTRPPGEARLCEPRTKAAPPTGGINWGDAPPAPPPPVSRRPARPGPGHAERRRHRRVARLRSGADRGRGRPLRHRGLSAHRRGHRRHGRARRGGGRVLFCSR